MVGLRSHLFYQFSEQSHRTQPDNYVSLHIVERNGDPTLSLHSKDLHNNIAPGEKCQTVNDASE